ncbi:MAG: hypothetical protein COA78_14130 [Blastopirellula sp.]|nr:MAG: hypothetical protein COA78_14130 [Blastopirellula sp.]
MLHTLGVAQYRVENYESALNTLQVSYEILKSYDSHHLFFIAMCHWHLEQQDEATEAFKKAIAWMDANAPTDTELIQFRREAIVLLSDHPKLNTAWRMQEREDWKGALTAYQLVITSLEQDDREVSDVNNIALRIITRELAKLSARRLQNWEVATKATLQCHDLIRLQGKSPNIMDDHRLTMLLIETKRDKERIEHVRKLVESIDTEKEGAQTMRIVVHSAAFGPIADTEFSEKVLALAQAAANKEPDSSYTALLLGLAQLRAGKQILAIENSERALSIWKRTSTQRSMALSCIAMSEFQLGNQEVALKSLELAREALPDLPEPDGKTDLGDSWRDMLSSKALLEEASKLLEEAVEE